MKMCWWILKAYLASCDSKNADVTGITNISTNEDYFLWHRSDKESYQEDATDGKYLTSSACVRARTHAHTDGIHKRMVQFQKLLKNLFLTPHGHNIHCQQRELSKFLVH
jgi:hypothetical protein